MIHCFRMDLKACYPLVSHCIDNLPTYIFHRARRSEETGQGRAEAKSGVEGVICVEPGSLCHWRHSNIIFLTLLSAR